MDARPFALGYVGVGLMGLPMVQRLTQLGWRVALARYAEGWVEAR